MFLYITHQRGSRVTIIVFGDGTLVVTIEPIEPMSSVGSGLRLAPFFLRREVTMPKVC